jgi:hypothetical protein
LDQGGNDKAGQRSGVDRKAKHTNRLVNLKLKDEVSRPSVSVGASLTDAANDIHR